MRYNGFLLIDYTGEPSLLFKNPERIPEYIINTYIENIQNLSRAEAIVIINPGNSEINKLVPCLIEYCNSGIADYFEDWFEIEITDK